MGGVVLLVVVLAAGVGACAPPLTCSQAGLCDEASSNVWSDQCAAGVLARGECPRAGALGVQCAVSTTQGSVRRYYYAPTTEAAAQSDCRAAGGRLERAP